MSLCFMIQNSFRFRLFSGTASNIPPKRFESNTKVWYIYCDKLNISAF